MKTLLSFILGLVALNAAAQAPILRGPGTTNTPANWTNVVRVIATNSLSHASKLTPGGVLPPLDGAALTNLPSTSSATGMQTNQFTTNVVGQPVIGRILLGSTGSIGADFQLRSTNTETSVSFGDQGVENRFRMRRSGGIDSFTVNSTNPANVTVANSSAGSMGMTAQSTINYLSFDTMPLVIANSLLTEFIRVNVFGGVAHLTSTSSITLNAPTSVIVTNNLVVQGAYLGKVGLATNSAGATVDSLSGSLANFQTNQFTTNVPGNPVLGKVLLGSTGTAGADFQVRSTNTSVSIAFGDQTLESRLRLFSSSLTLAATNSASFIVLANESPGVGGVVTINANQASNVLSFSVNPLVFTDVNGREFAKFNLNSGLEQLTATNLMTLKAPTVTVTNNLNVGGTLNVATMNVTNMVLVNLSNNYAYVSGNGTLTTTNNGLGWTNIQSTSIVSNGTLLTMTALGFDSPTNLWVANTSFGLGTNYTAVQAAGTVGIIGLLNKSSNTERYGQLVMLATGTVIFTNGVGFKCNDGLASRTITNGNSATIAIDFVPGVVTNLFIVQTW